MKQCCKEKNVNRKELLYLIKAEQENLPSKELEITVQEKSNANDDKIPQTGDDKINTNNFPR